MIQKTTTLSKEHKKALFLIQIGNFLEYFDLCLYMHMSIVLNDIFFPKNDPFMSSLLTAFTFSSTFLLRPLGALFFGYLGDHYGRKSTVIITTLLMALSSFIIAILPPYAQLGVTASVLLVFCRLLQGFSSVGETAGARTYVSEITLPPYSYFYTTLVDTFASIGSFFALLVGSLFVFLDGPNGWRMAFYFGAGIAVVGSIARTHLKETPEFIHEKRSAANNRAEKLADFLPRTWPSKHNFLCYIGVECLYPVCLYITYIYLGDILKNHFGFSPGNVLRHNLCVGLIEVSVQFVYAYLALRLYPLSILKTRWMLFLCAILVFPLLFNSGLSSLSVFPIFMIQVFLVVLGQDAIPAHAIFIRAFPTIGRYTQASLVFAISRTTMFIVTAYGCVFVGEYLGFEGISAVLFIVTLVSLYSVSKFKETEKADAVSLAA